MYEIYGHIFGSGLEALVIIAGSVILMSVIGAVGFKFIKDEKYLRRQYCIHNE